MKPETKILLIRFLLALLALIGIPLFILSFNLILINPFLFFVFFLSEFLFICLAFYMPNLFLIKEKKQIETNILAKNTSVEFENIYQELYNTHIKYAKYSTNYTTSYRSDLISTFVKLINKNLTYNIPKISNTVNLFDDKPFGLVESHSCNDYIEGSLDNETYVKIYNLSALNNNGNSFDGIFANTSCNKNINAYVNILRNDVKLVKNPDFVELDSKEFEKYFDVYSDNKIIAMQLLTSEIMEYLVDFHNQYNIDYEIAIINKKIYIRFFVDKILNPKIFYNSTNKQSLFKYYSILKFIIEVTQKINKTLQELEI
ncbi:MAG: DUF3137 domain-containing protein [Oscillospiraceae bacterium]|nr:DUF3137 domain-containing protein [Oscillospiraceae bacterium]